MYRNEFEKLYVNFQAEEIAQPKVDVGDRLRIDWDMFDHLRVSSDSERIISKGEAIQDVRDLFLLLKYAYSGFEYYSMDTDFERLEDKLTQELENNLFSNISSVDLCSFLYTELSPYINDGHVWVEYASFEELFLKTYIPFVTDLVVQKVQEQFIVVKGNESYNSGVSLQREDIRGDLFPTLIPGCANECYLIGCYAMQDPGYIEVSGHHCRTHMLKCCNVGPSVKDPYALVEETKYAVFSNPTYQIYEDCNVHERNFRDAGRICAAKDFVIWDLTNNHGGNSVYPEVYLRALNEYVHDEMDTAVLKSPIVGNSSAKKFYCYQEAPAFDNSNASYDGHLYIVMNKGTGSSAELAVLFANSCKKVIKIGSPSAGVGLFGEVRSYRLQNSGILVGLPYKVFYEDGFEIGKGYLPDYWIDDENPSAYLLKCLGECKDCYREIL